MNKCVNCEEYICGYCPGDSVPCNGYWEDKDRSEREQDLEYFLDWVGF